MKPEQREYLLRMAGLFATHAEAGEDLAIDPELATAWANALMAIVEDNTKSIILA